MVTTALSLGRALPSAETPFRILPRYWRADAFLLGLALCAVPVSIAIAESLLGAALLFRLAALFQHSAQVRLPGIFWPWLAWAGLEIVIWIRSTDHPAGYGEIRHLLLIAALFLVIPALDRPAYAVTIWRGIFLFSTLSSVFLIGDFIARLVRFSQQVSGSADPSVFLRSGGLPPLLALQSLAIFLSLTRMLWLCCLLLLILHLAWRHSKWILAVPLLPMVLLALAPGPVQFRMTSALQPAYHSNAERVQMLEVSTRMIRPEALTGVDPGLQLAAQFGLPVALAAVLFILLGFVTITPLSLHESSSPGQGYRFGPRVLAVLDRVVGTTLLTVSLPLMIPAAVTIRVLSRRSPFIAHLRIGRNGQTFWVWKLRTMWPRRQAASLEEKGWVQRIQCDPPFGIKCRNDSRVTSRFARFCRKYSIDELPQLFHVITGQMSLVGPRPLTRGELMQHYGDRANRILTLKPGLTGYWQISGRSRLSYAERVALDLQLVRDLSTRVYLQLLLRTIPGLIRGENAW